MVITDTRCRMKILGTKITPLKPEEIHTGISDIIRSGKKGFVLSGNIHGINNSKKHSWLNAFYSKADIVRVDGAGIVLGARILGYKIPKRLTWADWGWILARYLSEKGHSLYLLGGPKNIAAKAAEKLEAHAPGLKICGVHHGFFVKTGPQNNKIINKINYLKPDILIVGMGMPLQEKWLLENYADIDAKVFITAGAAFEYLSGSIHRCPDWMGDLGLEWLFRLALEPKRMWKRYLLGNAVFFINIFKQKAGLL